MQTRLLRYVDCYYSILVMGFNLSMSTSPRSPLRLHIQSRFPPTPPLKPPETFPSLSASPPTPLHFRHIQHSPAFLPPHAPLPTLSLLRFTCSSIRSIHHPVFSSPPRISLSLVKEAPSSYPYHVCVRMSLSFHLRHSSHTISWDSRLGSYIRIHSLQLAPSPQNAEKRGRLEKRRGVIPTTFSGGREGGCKIGGRGMGKMKKGGGGTNPFSLLTRIILPRGSVTM